MRQPDESRRSDKETASIEDKDNAKAKLGASGHGISGGFEAGAERLAKRGAERSVEYASKKIESLHRNIIRYKTLFSKISEVAGSDTFLLLDDLYHIRLSDQASVIDYFHRIAKGGNVWLKIGTIRHRSQWYFYGDPPTGMKLGDDAEQIDLDVTLEKYQTTKAFLIKILEQFAQEKSIKLSDILTDGARDRLVLASGGVARDFLTLFRRAMEEARERVLSGDLARGEKVGAEDVNIAAGNYYDHKAEELNRDTSGGDDKAEIMGQLEQIRSFCLEKATTNCILLEKDLGNSVESVVNELVDLKFLHHVRSRVTVRNRERRLYDGYMLDLSFYTGERKRRDFEMIEFWRSGADDDLRKSALIFAEKNSSPPAVKPVPKATKKATKKRR